MNLNALRESLAAIAARLKRIVPNRAPSIEAILDDPHALAAGGQRVFQNSRPAFVKGESLARIGIIPQVRESA